MNEVEAIRSILQDIPSGETTKLTRYHDEVWHDILKFQSSVNNVLRLMETHDLSLDDLRPDDTSMQPMIKTAVSDCWAQRSCTVRYVVERLESLLDGGDYHGIIRTAKWETND